MAVEAWTGASLRASASAPFAALGDQALYDIDERGDVTDGLPPAS